MEKSLEKSIQNLDDIVDLLCFGEEISAAEISLLGRMGGELDRIMIKIDMVMHRKVYKELLNDPTFISINN